MNNVPRNTRYASRDTQYAIRNTRQPSSALYICREPSTNQLLFMQNKPNFRKSQMNANLYNTTDYENKRNWTLGENKPNTNPIKPNFKRAKMNVKLLATKDYRKNDALAVRKNKANSNPISQRAKLIQSVYLQRIMKNNADMGYEKTNPIQTLP